MLTKQRFIRCVMLCGVVCATPLARAQCPTQWVESFPSGLVDAVVYASIVFDEDGAGPLPPRLIIAGDFVKADGRAVNHIARWNGKSWEAMGAGLNQTVYCLEAFDEDGPGSQPPRLFAGGNFAQSGTASVRGVAKWDGQAWVQGVGVFDGGVTALRARTVAGVSKLLIGGGFTQIDQTPCLCIAAWDGSQVTTYGPGVRNGSVYAVDAFDSGGGSMAYVGGDFRQSGTSNVACLARWNGGSWEQVAPNATWIVKSLREFDDGGGRALYVGGLVDGGGITRWNGTSFSSVGGGMVYAGGSALVESMCIADLDGAGANPPVLVATGHFTTAGATSVHNLAYWNGAAWATLGSGLWNGFGPRGYTVSVWDEGGGGPASLVFGGNFASSGNTAVSYIARWKGDTWVPFGNGLVAQLISGGTLYEQPNAMAVFDPDGAGPELPKVYVGGQFPLAGEVVSPSIASWDGTSWSSPGGGLKIEPAANTPPVVTSMLVFDDGSGPSLIAGGIFYVPGEPSVYSIAKWNGTQWSSLGGVSGPSSPYGMASVQVGGVERLMIGGYFPVLNAQTCNSIAMWDGAAWVPVGGGVTRNGGAGSTTTIAYFDPDGAGPQAGRVIVGGYFTAAGGVPAGGIAAWDGTSWSNMSGGLWIAGHDASAYTMAVYDDGNGPMLYVSGDFDRAGGAGGVAASNLARWTGEHWEAVPGSELVFGLQGLKVLDLDGPGPTPPALFAGAYSYQQAAYRVVRFQNGYWDALAGNVEISSSLGSAPGTLAMLPGPTGPELYVGGKFTRAGNTSAGRVARLRCLPLVACYANCDGSEAVPQLTANDFQCFLNRFAAGNPLANCDHSSNPPILNANDFQCFLNKFAAGCP